MGSIGLREIRDYVEQMTPILIRPTATSITISLSKRFFIFQIARQLIRVIEDEPYLNFISFLKNYKVLRSFLTGSISDIYRDRNKSYFRNFFTDKSLYELVKSDLEWIYERNRDIRLTVMKNGLVIYDNYKKNKFNILLLTVHSGAWMPKGIGAKQILTKAERALEEDTEVQKVYGDLFLAKGGIWIDCKFSRFACDLNRAPGNAIYSKNSEKWAGDIWKQELSAAQRKGLMQVYDEFYFILGKIVDAYKFNIIFDAHSMKDAPDRAEISFGTKYIPKFYLPVIKSMRKKMQKLGYRNVQLNAPYYGGHILEWLSGKFPDLFIFSMEVNKKLYLDGGRKKVDEKRMAELSGNITNIFDIEEET
ncbi:MAG: N-formylglutamate amidohydrolase [Candidatus Diapherotrites archaeon]